MCVCVCVCVLVFVLLLFAAALCGFGTCGVLRCLVWNTVTVRFCSCFISTPALEVCSHEVVFCYWMFLWFVAFVVVNSTTYSLSSAITQDTHCYHSRYSLRSLEICDYPWFSLEPSTPIEITREAHRGHSRCSLRSLKILVVKPMHSLFYTDAFYALLPSHQ